MAVRLALAGDQVHLVVAIEMNLVGAVAELLAFPQVRSDVALIASRSNQGWEPIKPGYKPFLVCQRVPCQANG